jgi:glutathione S-transferase
MRIVLHHCPQTRSDRVLWLLRELGVPFEVVEHPFGKALRDPGFLALSPAGRVPAVELDGAALSETGAIAEVLCERLSPEGLGRPAGHPERAEWLRWVHFAETVSQHVAALTQQHLMLREDWMRSPTLMKREAARLGKCYDALEARLAGRDWLLDGGFSAADVGVGQAVDMGRHFARTHAHPGVAAWMARCAARAAFAAAGLGRETYWGRAFYAPWPVEAP